MKDLYGKSYCNRGLSGLKMRFIQRVRTLCSDVLNLKHVILKRPVVIPAVLMLACSILCYYSSSFLPAVLIGIIVVAAGCYYAFFSRRKALSVMSVTAVTLMSVSFLLYIGLFISNRLNAFAVSDRLSCVVTDVTYDLSGDVDLTVRLDDGPYAKVALNCECEDINPGDALILYGKLKEPGKAGNPGEFDYRDYLRKQGILYTVSCEKYSFENKAGFPGAVTGFLQKGFFELRKSVFETVTESFDRSFKALTAAVCLGDRSLLPDNTERDFKLSCCSHLLAVSGTHFSGFLVCVPLVLNVLKVKRKNAIALHAVFCIFIGCLTGWSDSVTRAAVMSVCLFAEREWVSALSLSAVVMIVADPFCALSSGFQMSFCAVIAIKLYSGMITEFLMRFYISESFSKLISPAVAAGLGMMPFWSDISMRPDPEHLLIQTAGSFMAGAACTFFLPCVLLCSLFPFWSQYLSAPLLVCLDGLLKLVSFGGRLSEQNGMSVHLTGTLLALAGLFVFLYMIPKCLFRRVLIRPAAFVLAVAIGFEVVSYFDQPGCRVVFADVGQGDCCLIITPDSTCLIDGGTYREGSTTVLDLLDYYGICQVDVCIMSHWDADHAGGIAALCEHGRTKCIYTSYVPSFEDGDKDVQEFFEAVLPEPNDRSLYLSQLRPAFAGDRIELSDGVFLDVLYPSSGLGGGNESSMVLMLRVNGKDLTSILFTGDIGAETESLLIKEGIDLDCDILKVAHHGSKYSSSSEFLEACSPGIAVISVGEHNLYGHPAPATLDRLNSFGCEVFRTDKEGAVVLEY